MPGYIAIQRLLCSRIMVCNSTLALCCLLNVAVQPGFAQDASKEKKTDSPFAALEFRQIGPFRGGRVGAVTGVQSDPLTYYFGATGGGVFKTTDGGIHW